VSASSVAAPRESASPSKAWVRSLFSFPAMCMVLLAAVIFGLCVKQFAEPDIWWHLRSAQDLWQTHNFTPADTYSFTAAGSQRLNYEWLSELGYFFAYRLAGLRGILGLYFGLLVLTFSGVYYLCCTAGADGIDSVLAVFLGILLAAVSIGPRTLLFGWLCMVAILAILDRFRRTARGLWLMPAVFALWINLHPSWVFGLAVVVMTIACGLVEGTWGQVRAVKWTPAQLRTLLLTTAASVAALLVNPLGYKLALYPFDFLFRQQSNVSYIAEWQSVDFSSGDGKVALLSIIGLMAVALVSRRRWRLEEVVLTAFALWMALSHTRFLFFAGLILPPIFAQRINLFQPYRPDEDKPLLNAAIMGCILAGILVFFPSQASLQTKVDEEYPTAALKFMRENQLTGRTFNQYFWGGYMEWTIPELKTFVDGRADIFVYNGVLDAHRKATGIQQPLEVMDTYKIDYALLQPGSPLAYLMQHAAGWRQIYSDKVAVLIGRKSTRSFANGNAN
jgi:hypothetical protein